MPRETATTINGPTTSNRADAMPAQTKSCSKCKVVKPHSEFSPNKNTKSGRSSWCKACTAEAARMRLSKDRERINARRREIYAADPERHRAYARKHHEANREAGRQRCRDWYARNREYRAAYSAAYRASPAGVAANKRASAKRWEEIDRPRYLAYLRDSNHFIKHLPPLEAAERLAELRDNDRDTMDRIFFKHSRIGDAYGLLFDQD